MWNTSLLCVDAGINFDVCKWTEFWQEIHKMSASIDIFHLKYQKMFLIHKVNKCSSYEIVKWVFAKFKSLKIFHTQINSLPFDIDHYDKGGS